MMNESNGYLASTNNTAGLDRQGQGGRKACWMRVVFPCTIFSTLSGEMGLIGLLLRLDKAMKSDDRNRDT